MALLVMHAGVAFADPVAIKVKQGLLVRPDDTEVTVDGGLYLNDDARQQVLNDLTNLEAQNIKLAQSLESANKKIIDSSGYIPGLPTWAAILISTVLTGATMAFVYFAARDTGSKI